MFMSLFGGRRWSPCCPWLGLRLASFANRRWRIVVSSTRLASRTTSASFQPEAVPFRVLNSFLSHYYFVTLNNSTFIVAPFFLPEPLTVEHMFDTMAAAEGGDCH